MRRFHLQRGQLLVAGIVLIVVIALMIAALGYLYVSGESGGALHGQSERAYFAARSGIEYSSGQYFNGSACSSLNNANVPVGGAGVTFTLTPTPTLYAPLTLTGTTAALTAASASIPVTSTAGYAPYGRLLIDSELINYTSTTATNFNGLTRGVGGTTAAAHAAGVTVSQNLCVVSSKGTAGNANRIVEGALGAGTTASPGALGTMGADAMVVYAKGTALTGGGSNTNVYYRLWDSSVNDWGPEQTAQPVSATPVFIVVRFARTRNEAIMGVLDGNNQLFIQVWNGRTWTIPAGGGPLDTASTNAARTFQIAYEYTSDIARIVYQNNTRDPQYATWNGTTLTANGMILPPGGTYPTQNAATRHLWFRLAPRNVAGSNDILLMSFDSREDVYGLRWTGAAWSNMGTAARWDTTTSDATNREAIDVGWQSDGNVAVFVYGDASNQGIRYRTWDATTSTLGALSAVTTLATPGGYTPAPFEWVRLYPGPGNSIVLMLQTAIAGTNPSLQSTTWASGTSSFNTASPPVTGHDNGNAAATGVENAASRGFDFVWEQQPKSSGNGWLLWGSLTATAGIHARYFTSPATWGAATSVRDRTLLVQAGALSPSGRFVAGAYQATASANDDTESLTTSGGGTAWPNAATTLWPGATTVQQGERVYVVTREGNRINTGASGTGVVSILETHEVVP
ncbi:MAG: hypothetical protein E6H70_00395 [Betaproteobacteria bacterium]|nr:MAG: hypothetical protein E6H70_00395 [Betaproteobacteria bacterium]